MGQSQIDIILEKEAKVKIEKELAIQKALASTDINQIYKAQNYIKGLQQREEFDTKSLMVDPLAMTHSFGYRDKPFSLSYTLLRGMAKTHIIKAIIETRKEQIQAFCTPQRDKYSTGFVVKKKQKYTLSGKQPDLTKAEENRIEDIINFLLNCGNSENFWHADSFDVFIGKIVDDSLTLDQATFENVRNKRGELVEFFATDGATFRIADSYDDDDPRNDEPKIKGYTPSYLQLYQERTIAEFYPWELGFGIRNPQTSIYSNGYGKSELEDMIQTVTAILNADLYNGNFFKVGSAPKGILRYSGNINTNTIEDFKKQWQAQVAGVANAHKIPTINADKMDFISTQTNNKDMEFEKYQEFLIKISCAQYKIDPSEIGFPMNSGGSGGGAMFESNNESKLKYSKDKGLKPLLKRVEAWMNKWVVSQLDPNYEFRFVGIDAEEEDAEVDRLNKKVQNGMGVKEWREAIGLERDLEEDDFPLNPVWMQKSQMDSMADQGANDEMDDMYDEGEQGQEDNPFMKSLADDLEEILTK